MKYLKEAQELLKKAKRSLQASKDLLENGYADFSVSRAYYSMFYCAEAMLISKELSYSKHSAVIAAFGKEFVKTGILRTELHLYLRNAFDLRAKGDYDTIQMEKKEAKQTIEQASKFIKETEDYLSKITP